MPAYIIANLKVSDPQQFERYKALSTAAVKAHAGRFIVRGGRFESVEGGWVPDRLTVIEFPTWESAMAFVHSAEYSQARVTRQEAATVQMILVEGV
jgi:uncharacterized protein (DUF1330 family)